MIDDADAALETEWGTLPPAKRWCSNILSTLVSHFGNSGGFSTLLAYMAAPTSAIPLEVMSVLSGSLVAIARSEYMTKPRKVQVLSALGTSLQTTMTALDDTDLRELSPSTCMALLENLQTSLAAQSSAEEAGSVVEPLMLDITHRLLTATALKLRIQGMDILNEVLSMVDRRAWAIQAKRTSRVKAAHWLSPEFLIQWISEHHILENLAGASKHAELLRRASQLVVFLVKRKCFTDDDLTLLWECVVNAHEIYSSAVLELLRKVAFQLPVDMIGSMFSSLSSLPPAALTKDMLQLVRVLIKRTTPHQKPMLEWMLNLVLTNPADPTDPVEPAEEDDTRASPELVTYTLDCITDAWKIYALRSERTLATVRVINLLKNIPKASLPLKFLISIIDSYPDVRSSHVPETRASIIHSLREQHDVSAVIIDSVPIAVASLGTVFATPAELQTELAERFEFLKTVLGGHDDVRGVLTLDQVVLLYSTLVANSDRPGEAELFFQFISEALTPSTCSILSMEDAHALLESTLAKQEPKTITPTAFAAFRKYFISALVAQNTLEWAKSGGENESPTSSQSSETFDFVVVNPDTLDVSYVWDLVLAGEPNVVAGATDLLVELHENLDGDVRNDPVQLADTRAAFLGTIMDKLKAGLEAAEDGQEAGVRHIFACLQVLKSLFAKTASEAGGVRAHGAASRGRPVTLRILSTIESAMPAESFEINLHSLATIAALRKAIATGLDAWDQPPGALVLKHNGDVLNDDTVTLQDAAIRDSHSISVSSGIQETLEDDATTRRSRNGDAFVAEDTSLSEELLDDSEDPLDAGELASQLVLMCGVTIPVALLALRKESFDANDAAMLLLDPSQKARFESLAELAAERAANPDANKEPAPGTGSENNGGAGGEGGPDSRLAFPDEDGEGGDGEEDGEDNPPLYPPMILSSNQEYMDVLFQLVSSSAAKEVGPKIWDLLMVIPTNRSILRKLTHLDLSSGWDALLDPTSVYRLLYSLQIIDTVLFPVQEGEDVRARTEWCRSFVTAGGVEHLYSIFTSDALAVGSGGDSEEHAQGALSLVLKILELFLRGSLGSARRPGSGSTGLTPRSPAAGATTPTFASALLSPAAAETSDNDKQAVSFAAGIEAFMASPEVCSRISQTISVQQMVPSLLELIRTTATLETPSLATTEVTAFSMRLLVLCLVSQPSLVGLLYDVASDSFFSATLIEASDAGVRAEVAVGLYNLCRGIETAPGALDPPGTFVRSALLRLVPDPSVADAMDQYGEYFSLLVQLLEDALGGGGDGDGDGDEHLLDSLRSVLNQAVGCVLTRGTLEFDGKVADEVLAGYMDLIRVVAKSDPEALESAPRAVVPGGDESLDNAGALVQYLHEVALFATLKADERRSSGTAPPPMCKSNRTRQAAYALQLALADGKPETATSLLEKLAPYHEGDSFEQVSGWTYYPGANARAESGYSGLVNFGCTCYVNSMLQQLFMVPAFRNTILALDVGALMSAVEPSSAPSSAAGTEADGGESESEGGRDALAPGDSLIYQLQSIFVHLLESDKKAYEPEGFMTAFKDWEGRPINPKVQQDVNEFFNILCGNLEEELKRYPGGSGAEIVKALFGGKLSNQIRSREAEYPYYGERLEDFYNVSLDIKGKGSIEEALDFYVEPDVMDGENAYYCEPHERKIAASRGACLHSVSDVFIVHLKRFEFNYQTMERTKVDDRCTFPLELNVEPWTREGLARREKEAGGVPLFEPEHRPEWYYEYELTGVLVHSGMATGGHYYSFIKTPGECAPWLEFNDSAVTKFNIERDLESACFGGDEIVKTWSTWLRRNIERKIPRSNSAYVLIYQRKVRAPEGWVDVHAVDDEMGGGNGGESKKGGEGEEVVGVEELVVRDEAWDGVRSGVDPDVVEAVWRENVQFARERFFFSSTYFDYILDLCRKFPFEDNMEYPGPVVDAAEAGGEDPGLRLIQMGTRVVFEVLVRAREDTTLSIWFELLNSLYARHIPAAVWFLDYARAFVKPLTLICPKESVRINVVALIVNVMKLVHGFEVEVMTEIVEAEEETESEPEGDDDEGEGEGEGKGEGRKVSAVMRMMDAVWGEFEVSRTYWRQFRQYWRLYRGFAELSWQTRKYLVDEGFFRMFIDYYLGSDLPGGIPRVQIMDDNQLPDLTHFMAVYSLVFRGCETDSGAGPPPTSLYDEGNDVNIELTRADEVLVVNDKWLTQMIQMDYNHEAVTEILRHVTFGNQMMSKRVLQILGRQLYTGSESRVGPNLDFIQSLLRMEDGMVQQRITWALAANAAVTHFGVLRVVLLKRHHVPAAAIKMVVWVMKQAQELPAVADYVASQRAHIKWMEPWLHTQLVKEGMDPELLAKAKANGGLIAKGLEPEPLIPEAKPAEAEEKAGEAGEEEEVVDPEEIRRREEEEAARKARWEEKGKDPMSDEDVGTAEAPFDVAAFHKKNGTVHRPHNRFMGVYNSSDDEEMGLGRHGYNLRGGVYNQFIGVDSDDSDDMLGLGMGRKRKKKKKKRVGEEQSLEWGGAYAWLVGLIDVARVPVLPKLS